MVVQYNQQTQFMKNTVKIIVSILLLSGCSSNISKVEDILLPFSGIEFSKSINDASKHCEIDNNRLSLQGVSGTNYFNAPDGSRKESSAPILLMEIDNNRPFTFTTKLQTEIGHTYDAGALFIYMDNNDWLKYAFELDEKGRRRIVTVRTRSSSDDNNHDIINQDFVYLKISSNIKQIGFYYSLDGTNWNMARLFKNEYSTKLWLGVSSQSPGGKGNMTHFEEMSLTFDPVTNFRLGR